MASAQQPDDAGRRIGALVERCDAMIEAADADVERLSRIVAEILGRRLADDVDVLDELDRATGGLVGVAEMRNDLRVAVEKADRLSPHDFLHHRHIDDDVYDMGREADAAEREVKAERRKWRDERHALDKAQAVWMEMRGEIEALGVDPETIGFFSRFSFNERVRRAAEIAAAFRESTGYGFASFNQAVFTPKLALIGETEKIIEDTSAAAAKLRRAHRRREEILARDVDNARDFVALQRTMARNAFDMFPEAARIAAIKRIPEALKSVQGNDIADKIVLWGGVFTDEEKKAIIELPVAYARRAAMRVERDALRSVLAGMKRGASRIGQGSSSRQAAAAHLDGPLRRMEERLAQNVYSSGDEIVLLLAAVQLADAEERRSGANPSLATGASRHDQGGGSSGYGDDGPSPSPSSSSDSSSGYSSSYGGSSGSD